MEIWSDRDIRNGRRLTHVLFTGIVAKEIAVVVGLATGFLHRERSCPPVRCLSSLPKRFARPSPSALPFVLMIFAYGGHSWARLGLGLNYLFISGWVGLECLARGRCLSDCRLEIGHRQCRGGALDRAAPYLRHAAPRLRLDQRTRRRTIPVPLDDQPARRTMRRSAPWAKLSSPSSAPSETSCRHCHRPWARGAVLWLRRRDTPLVSPLKSARRILAKAGPFAL